MEKANLTAASLKGKWPGPRSRPYTDPWATFRAWVTRREPANIAPDDFKRQQRQGRLQPETDPKAFEGGKF